MNAIERGCMSPSRTGFTVYYSKMKSHIIEVTEGQRCATSRVTNAYERTCNGNKEMRSLCHRGKFRPKNDDITREKGMCTYMRQGRCLRNYEITNRIIEVNQS